MKAVKLHFGCPVRAGVPGIGLEGASCIFPSTTLFGALATALAECEEDVPGFIEMVEKGRLEFSSCFPFIGERLLTCQPCFNPSPSKLIELNELENLKQYPETGWDENEFIVDIPKVSLDRESRSSTIYYTSAAYVRNGGLYFLVRGDLKPVETALRYLREEGIGGKRSWGMGALTEYEIEKVSLKTEGNVYMTLSACVPAKKDSLLYWKPYTRGGWSCDGRAKPKLVYAAEGSVFREMDRGRIIRVGDVYIYALSFLIPLPLEGENEA